MASTPAPSAAQKGSRGISLTATLSFHGRESYSHAADSCGLADQCTGARSVRMRKHWDARQKLGEIH
eukprot:s2252_g13.t1